MLIFSKPNLKLQVFGLFSRFVRTLNIEISSSEGPANTTSIHKVRNIGKLVILLHPSPKNKTKRCRSPRWKPAEAGWEYDAARAEQNSTGACATKCPSVVWWLFPDCFYCHVWLHVPCQRTIFPALPWLEENLRLWKTKNSSSGWNVAEFRWRVWKPRRH